MSYTNEELLKAMEPTIAALKDAIENDYCWKNDLNARLNAEREYIEKLTGMRVTVRGWRPTFENMFEEGTR